MTAPEQVEGRDGTPVGRRAILALLGLGVGGVLVGSRIQDVVARTLRPLTIRDGTGLSSLLPGAGRFRIYSVTGDLPSESTVAYRLKVGGMVERPTALTLPELKALPITHLTKDFQCVTGWRVADVKWSGVKLADLLDHVGVKPGATHLRFTSFDGTYTESLTMAQARRADVLVAYAMIGKTVTNEHGGPVRLYVAPMYGYKSCKWLDGIEVVNHLEPGYWENLGYDIDGWVGDSNGRTDQKTS